METIKSLCKPRESVFNDITSRDDVLNLSDLVEGWIDQAKFFDENFKTKSMEILFETALKRFSGKSDTGVIKLTQAMGGGKTHNMLALALLAQNLDWCRKIVGKEYDNIGEVKVVAFSWRGSDFPFDIWGSIAEQLGCKEFFADHYSPLKAPGESAWVNLLKDQRVLILLDELPSYLVNAKSITIGNSDLCTVTITAIFNLFTAIGKGQLAKVCLVFSALRATYESGSELLSTSFKELENEANRVALNLEPVALNTDEVYDILRKRLFAECPSAASPSINEIAVAYKDSLVGVGKSGLTGYTGDAVFFGIKDSHPFHPSIKELYASFKENSGFQQTRGLIKLMRQVVRGFFESGNAEKKNLINVFDIDLNERRMLSLFKQINPTLEAAISHDIAQGGKSVAEIIDAQNGEKKKQYAQDVAKFLLVSLLNETPNDVMGLVESDILGFLCEPGIDLNSYKKALDEIVSQCWYLKTNNRGRFYFQNTKNMVAEMNTLVDSYSNESAKKELRKFLEGNFEPKLKKCYEQLYVLPALDEIHVEQNKVTLVIFEPHTGTGLHQDLQSFYDTSPYKNRILFLSGQRNVMEKLYANAKRLAAIRQIIANMKAEHSPETDQQHKKAESQHDNGLPLSNYCARKPKPVSSRKKKCRGARFWNEQPRRRRGSGFIPDRWTN
jgi:predicted AAA+ superfamily ATPase